MKKTYINPTLDVVRIQTQQMLAGSIDKNDFGGGSGSTSGSGITDAGGRESDLDDDF